MCIDGKRNGCKINPVGGGGVDWIRLDGDTNRLPALVKKVINPLVL